MLLWTELVIEDAEGGKIEGAERDAKIEELHRTNTMLDAWIRGEDWESAPVEIDWTGYKS